MDVTYWDSLAADYQNDVLEIAQNDINGILKKYINRFSNKNLIAADLGCGAGALLELVQRKFKHIYAVDHAEKLLAVAEARINAKNVEYVQADLTRPNRLNIRADITFCLNVLISPDKEKRDSILQSILRVTKTRGYCIIVVPSYESILHVYRTMMLVDVNQGESYTKAHKKMKTAFERDVISSIDGVVNIGGELTKSYAQEELIQLFKDFSLKLDEIQKIEYSWGEEIDNHPKWLAAPYPWDWMCVCQKSAV